MWETTEVLLMFRLVGRGAAATGCGGSAWLFVPQCFASVGTLSLFSSSGGAVPMSADARRSAAAGGCRPLISVGHRRLFILLRLAEPSLKSQSIASRKPRGIIQTIWVSFVILHFILYATLLLKSGINLQKGPRKQQETSPGLRDPRKTHRMRSAGNIGSCGYSLHVGLNLLSLSCQRGANPGAFNFS